MLKHTAILGALVVVLVAALVYVISPGEVVAIYCAASYQVQSQVQGGPAGNSYEQAGDGSNSALRVARWLRSPPVWMMLAGILCAGSYIGRKRFKRGKEGKMANSLSRAVRRIRDEEEIY